MTKDGRLRPWSVLAIGLAWIFALSYWTPSVRAGWLELKPIFGGGVERIVVDAGGMLYASGSGGLFRSADGGTSWTMALGNLPTTQIGEIVPDPVEVGVLYVWTDEGLYRTTDAANTWTRLPLDLPTGVYVTRLAIAPSDTSYVFAATWGSFAWRSRDRGMSWEQCPTGLAGGWSGPSYLTSMNVDPTNRNRVYTSTWRGRLFRSDDAAATWYQIADSGTWANGQIQVSRSSPNVLYTHHDKYWFGRDTVLRSTDYGSTWVYAGQPTDPSATYDLAIDPTDSDIVYAVTNLGIYKTINAGLSWTRAFQPPSGPTDMLAVALEPSDPSRVYAGANSSGFYRSLDAGASWSQHNSGLSMAEVRGIEICRDVPSTVYVGAAGEGFFKSTNGGTSWSLIGTAQGLENHAIYGLGVHPQNPDVLVTSTRDDSTLHVWRTTDGGSTFSAVAGYGTARIQFNPLAPNYVHASIGDSLGGFLRSADTGSSWNVPHGWYRYPTYFTFHPSSAGVVINSVNRYTGSALNLLSIMYSNDYGSSWTETSAFGRGNFRDSALDQNDPTTLYVVGDIASEASRGVYKFNVTYSGSSVASVNRVPGTFNDGLATETVRRLLYDSANGYLYASTPVGVFRSDDQAASWASINDGLPYLSTNAMAISPDGLWLLVGTSGGVWEYSDSLPVEVATPSLSTVPPDLLIEAFAGLPMPPLGVTAQSTTAADTLVLTTTGALPPNMSFLSTDGHPATGTLDFTPAGNQRGLSYEIGFLATSTLDPTKSATLTRYVAVLGDATTDASVLIASNSAGSVSTPDGAFTLHLAAGSIPGTDPYAVVNVIQRPQLKQADARISGGKAKILNGYDIDVSNQEHFTFANAVALTFYVEPGSVQDLADVEVYTYNEATDLWELRTDTSCLAPFSLPPYTGDAASGGTVSVCTTTLSTWATVDMGTFVEETPPVAADDSYVTEEDVELSVPAPGVLANDSDDEEDPLTAVRVAGPAHGTLVLGENGSFVYAPEPDFYGQDSFTYLASDGSFESNTATVTIDIQAVNDPPEALCVDVQVAVDEACQGDAAASQVDGGSFDPEGDSITLTLDPAGPYGLGSNAVTLRVTDENGGEAACEATVTAFDALPPEILCPPPVEVVADATCMGEVPDFAAVTEAADNCTPADGLTLTQDPPPGETVGLGSHVVTVSATDASGNSASCQTALLVPFEFDGFLPPIGGGDDTGGELGEPVRSFKLGRTIPVKFRISCDAVPGLEGVHTLQAIYHPSATEADPPIDPTSTDPETEGNEFRLADETWHFNLDTRASGLHKGPWELVATLSDGTHHRVWIELR